jgi:hypothetical protein
MLTTERLAVLTSSVIRKDVFSSANVDVLTAKDKKQQQHATIIRVLVRSWGDTEQTSFHMGTPQ